MKCTRNYNLLQWVVTNEHSVENLHMVGKKSRVRLMILWQAQTGTQVNFRIVEDKT